MEGLDKGGQGPTSGCYAIEEEEYPLLGNDSINTFPRKETLGKIGHPLLVNG
jgi:hypothetical protein